MLGSGGLHRDEPPGMIGGMAWDEAVETAGCERRLMVRRIEQRSVFEKPKFYGWVCVRIWLLAELVRVRHVCRNMITIAIDVFLAFAAATFLVWLEAQVPSRALADKTSPGPYSNQPLALTWDDSKLAVVNPEAGTVSIFQVAGDANTKTTEVQVGKQPAGVAWSGDGSTLYVANQADGAITRLR